MGNKTGCLYPLAARAWKQVQREARKGAHAVAEASNQRDVGSRSRTPQCTHTSSGAAERINGTILELACAMSGSTKICRLFFGS
jgi:hypothetical protein